MIGATPLAMDRAAISRLTTAQLTHLILLIIVEICNRLGIELDHTAIFTFQFPAESYRDLEAHHSDD